MKPFEAYVMYVALKMHFESDSYDYVKYNGKIRATELSFSKRRDAWQFTRLARVDNVENLILAHCIDSKLGWIGDLLKPEADEVRKNWEKRIESLTYLYTSEIKKLNPDFTSNFKVIKGEHPKLLKLYMHKEVSPETMVILNDLVHFRPIWDAKIRDEYIWPSISMKLLKYRPFVKFDREKFRKITVDQFSA